MINILQDHIFRAKEQLTTLVEHLSPSTERIFALEYTAQDVEKMSLLEQQMCDLLFSQLQQLGLFIDAQYSLAVWKKQIELPALFEPWLEQTVRILKAQGYLTDEDDICEVKEWQELDSTALWAEWDKQKSERLKDSNLRVQVQIVDATLRALPEILRGKRSATEILFPNSSMEFVEGVYKNNKVADYFNAVLADTLVEYIEARRNQDSTASIRILEIGAGTGGTSAGLFNRLKPYESSVVEYCYTDLSKAFLMHAEQEYGPTTKYLNYRLLNIEKALKPQGIELGAYDVVIATNVLHATMNIRNTLRNAKAALKGNGLLLLNEMLGSSLFTHLTFGLLEGWWLFEDKALRMTGTPALGPESWQRALEDEGFRHIFFPSIVSKPSGQQIIVAESDGLIRQSQQQKNVLTAGLKADRRLNNAKTRQASNNINENKLSQLIDVSNDQHLRDKLVVALTAEVGKTLKIDSHQIDSSETLEKYGVDSILVVKMTEALSKVFANISSTLFFDYRTIDDLADNFIATEMEAVRRWVGVVAPRSSEVTATTDPHVHNNAESRLKPRVLRSQHNLVESATAAARPKLRSDLTVKAETSPQPIAIVGLSGRYPEARNLEEFWSNLKSSKHCIREIPKERWDWQSYYSEEKGLAGAIYSKWGGFLNEIDKFDPLFFNLSPREAERMDPQERLFLEEAYASIEDAGYTPASVCLSKRVGVYVGVTNSTYQRHTNLWSCANRVSYRFDFQGPSMAVDTACSSSLTAIHLATEALQYGRCEVAIAGGVNLIVNPIHYIGLSAMRMLTNGKECRPFGDKADGFVDAEGVGAAVLKPLHQAVADGDHVYGVIKASAVNAGGNTNGYTVPNPTAQEAVVAEALSLANIDPRVISYIEAHGTGTSLGDPIEIAGLSRAFLKSTQDKQFCAIGSVKSNIGHCESAAGIAGLTKVLLQMQHKTLVPSLHSQVLNPRIDFGKTPFIVQQSVREWKRPMVVINGNEEECLRTAGISSFGAGGANAHLILEEYQEPDQSERPSLEFTPEHPAFIVFSARDDVSLKEKVKRLLAYVNKKASCTAGDLANISYTLQTGRELMDHRLAFTAATIEELQGKLAAYVDGKIKTGEIPGCYLGYVKKNMETFSIFNSEDSLQEVVNTWIEQGRYTKLLELWVKGLSFDWIKLYDGSLNYLPIKPRRISLPTYPFARERYWMETSIDTQELLVDDEIEVSVVIDSQLSQGKEDEVSESSHIDEENERMLFAEEWQLSASGNSGALLGSCTVAVFLSDPNHRAELLATVARKNKQARVVFIAQSADAKTQIESDISTGLSIKRGVSDSYVQVLQRIVDELGQINAVWYLWGIEDSSCIEDQGPIVHLLQGLSSVGISQSKVLLAGDYESELSRCYFESWIGYERSLKNLLPEMQLAVVHGDKRIDEHETVSREESVQSSGLIERWACRLWSELQEERIESALYIGERRYVLRVRAMEANSNNLPRLRTCGTYVITGGLGGLGYLFAEYLAKHYSARIILLGRSSMDSAKEPKLLALEELGGQAIYLSADVSDKEQLSEALDKGRVRFGELHGVIHAAGIQGGETIFSKDLREFESVLAPNIIGTRNLNRLCNDQTLDFICHFSSSSAILGDFGSCDYAVGNRFELAYAKYVNRKAIAICWPMWAESGMGFQDNEAARLYLASSGQGELRAVAGVELFEQVLGLHEGDGTAQALVMLGKKSRVHRLLGLTTPNDVKISQIEFQLKKQKCVEKRRPELQGLTLSQCVLWELQGIVSELLKLPRERLDAEENLAEFGVDSISLAQLAKILSERYGVEVTPAIFFSQSNLSKLTEYFVSTHSQIVQQHYPEQNIESSAQLDTGGQSSFAGKHPVATGRTANSQVRSGEAKDLVEPIAIIGMSGRFPGARNIEEMWQVLVSGQDAVQEIPLERFDWRTYYQEQTEGQLPNSSLSGKTNSKWLGAIPGVDEFDPLFFEISPRDAKLMVPRQRLLLQESFNALEDAGYGDKLLRRDKVGVFVGVEQGDYQMLAPNNIENGSITANHDGILAARLSYFLNLRGPALAINTACSSGLVAAHQAYMSVRSGECHAAIAAGVNLILTPYNYIGMTQSGMLSPEGRCYAFDRRANGMVPGEAVVAIVLKPLSRAKSDGDAVKAIIRGSGVNYDGRTNGLTAPCGAAQTELIEDVYQRAAVTPQDIEYVVTHGTGTRLGDPVEIQALRDTFKGAQREEPYCALTSTKTNLGHTFAASGLVSLVSLVQALIHETIPASLYCEQLSDYIDWVRSPFYVNTQNKEWPKEFGKQRLGAVSAFGMSGTNAHMVVESYDQQESEILTGAIPSHLITPSYLLVLSAKTDAVLQQRVRDLIDILDDDLQPWNATTLASMSHTLLSRRQHFAHRCALVVEGRKQAVALLEKVYRKESHPVLIQAKVAHDFVPQPLLLEYADELLSKLCQLQDDPGRYQQTLATLSDLYCQGYSPNWDAMYGDNPPQCISLPTYPFSTERYWIDRVDDLNFPRDTPQRSLVHPSSSSEKTSKSNEGYFGFVEESQVDCIIDLKTVLADVLGIGNTEIEESRPLGEYGLDSIASIKVSRAIQSRVVDFSLPDQLSMANLSIRQLTNYMKRYSTSQLNCEKNSLELNLINVEKVDSSSLNSGSSVGNTPTPVNLIEYDERSVKCLKHSEKAIVRLLVFYCFGFGEKGLSWLHRLPDEVEVWGVGSTSIANWDELTETLATGVRGLFDKPVVVWGHSMGAIVAFEVMSHLQQHYNLKARQLLFSSSSSPEVFERVKFSSPFYEIDDQMSDQKMERSLRENHIIVSREWGIPVLSPQALRQDVALMKSYSYDRKNRVGAPLCLIQANNDIILSDSAIVEHWQTLADDNCSYEEVEGTHLFFMNPPQGFVDILLEKCREPSPADAGQVPAGVYKLEAMTSGTRDIHLLPLGKSGRGVIFYSPDGQMAAHTWHPNRLPNSSDEYSSIEDYMTYQAYSGDYEVNQGVIEHHVLADTSHRFDGKTLRRYLDWDEHNLVLATSPVVMEGGKQDGSSSYQSLVWSPMVLDKTIDVCELVGCWELRNITSVIMEITDMEWKGRCIIMPEGSVSIVIQDNIHHSFSYKNPALTTCGEIEQIVRCTVAWAGRLLSSSCGQYTAETWVSQVSYPIDFSQVIITRIDNCLTLKWPLRRAIDAEEQWLSMEWDLIQEAAAGPLEALSNFENENGVQSISVGEMELIEEL